jgi:quercetin dioxygenase-like cupin family protein/Sec-independent protein translocase protein TatA
MFGVGVSELFVILCVAVLLIKPRDLPKVFRSLGRLYSRFRAYYRELQSAQDRFFYDIQKEPDGGGPAGNDTSTRPSDQEVPGPAFPELAVADPVFPPSREDDEDAAKDGNIGEKGPLVLGEPNALIAEHFVGTGYLSPLKVNEASIFTVTFEAGCRSSWHIHHAGGRFLFCTDGVGWFQEDGKAARKLLPGDVVYVKPEVRHWLGADKESSFTHISIEVPSQGGTTEWLEPVGEEDYLALGKAE